MVSVTPSTSVRAGGNVVGGIHDIYGGGARPNHESGRAGSCAGIARAAGVAVGGGGPHGEGGGKVRAGRRGQKPNAGPMAPKPPCASEGGKAVVKTAAGHMRGR